MTEYIETHSGEPNSHTVILDSAYACGHCRIGSEDYDQVFDEGACVACGAPAETVLVSEKRFDRAYVQRSILIIGAPDASERIQDMQQEMEAHNIKTFVLQDIASSIRPEVAASNIRILIEDAAFAFVIPSPELKDNKAVNYALDHVAISVDRDTRYAPLVPIYFEDTQPEHMFTSIAGRMGIAWDNSRHDRKAVDREEFFEDIAMRIEERASSQV